MASHTGRTLPVALIALGLTFGAAPALADIDHQRARALQQQGHILPLEQIIDKALGIKSGRVIETELDEENGRLVYELEILDDRGWVWEMEFDAKTGELRELELDD